MGLQIGSLRVCHLELDLYHLSDLRLLPMKVLN